MRNVALLRSFVTATQQNNQRLPVPSEIDAVARSNVHLQF